MSEFQHLTTREQCFETIISKSYHQIDFVHWSNSCTILQCNVAICKQMLSYVSSLSCIMTLIYAEYVTLFNFDSCLSLAQSATICARQLNNNLTGHDASDI